jgi:hypothetical protein
MGVYGVELRWISDTASQRACEHQGSTGQGNLARWGG